MTNHIADQKYVQALIQVVVEMAAKLDNINTFCQTSKTNYLSVNPDLSNTQLQTSDLVLINAWFDDIKALITSPVVVGARALDQPSHGTIVLE